jgi:ribosomal protein S18 acetylase RimI-like enzyme
MVELGLATIRGAEDGDAQAFQLIENSAGTLFEEVPGLAWLASAEDLSVDRYSELIGQGFSWCAVSGAGKCVGFVCGAREDFELHIWELAVLRDWQRRGIGRALLNTALRAAADCELSAVTLTTFQHVSWNASFYHDHGFRVLESSEMGSRLRSLLEEESLRGLPSKLRCAMRLQLTRGALGSQTRETAS